MRTLKHYIINHWRGRLNLVKSFWINFVLINLAILYGLDYIHIYFDSWSDQLAAVRCFTTAMTVWWAVFIWQFVGCWRSARNLKNKSDETFVGLAVQVVLVGGLLTAVPTSLGYVELTEISTCTDGLSQYSLEVYDGEIILKGAFAFGLENDLEKILKENDEIYIINLNSQGGRVRVAEKVSKLISEYGLMTYSGMGCLSACTTAFIAGRYRILNAEAQLGFHAASFSGVTKEEIEELEESTKIYYKSRNISDVFVEKAFKTSSDDMWYPTVEELSDNNVITHIVKDGKLFSVK
jgi:hypothetical protein